MTDADSATTAPDPAPVGDAGIGNGTPTRTAKFAWGAIVVLLAGVIALVVVALTTPTTTLVINRPQAPEAVVRNVSDISQATFNSVGVTSPQVPLVSPVLMHGQPALNANGKPEVLYVGAEYCSFCAAERWALVVALSRFGTFTGLRNMQSSSTSAFPEIQSFSFDGATYRSPYVAFSGIEEYSDAPGTDGIFTRITFPTAAQQATVNRYGPIAVPGWTARSGGNLFPFVDVANRAVLGTSQFSPAAIEGQSQAAVAGRLDDPTNAVTKAVIGSANDLTAVICMATDQQPPKLCASKGVRDALGSLTAS
jgi:thiol-disulfide isomerase/thioredoxin